MMHHLGAIPASSPSPCLMGGLAAARIFQQSRPSQKVTRCDGPRATSPRYKAGTIATSCVTMLWLIVRLFCGRVLFLCPSHTHTHTEFVKLLRIAKHCSV